MYVEYTYTYSYTYIDTYKESTIEPMYINSDGTIYTRDGVTGGSRAGLEELEGDACRF